MSHSREIVLTEDQQFIIDDLEDRLGSSFGRIDCCINGYAGTGKSTTVSRLIKTLSENGYDVAATSPTHKANSVLRKMLRKDKIHVDVMTIHSFLGLKLVQKKDKQVLEYDKHSPNAKKRFDILVVDECSMISTELYMHLQSQSHRIRSAIIFIGDKCQLPPVEPEISETIISISFNQKVSYSLTNVLRQALDNSIISFATEVRESIGTGNNPLNALNSITTSNPNVIKLYSQNDIVETYIGSVNHYSTLFDAVQEYKILSYTNKNVDYYNTLIRYRLIDSEVEFKEGEPIVFEECTQNCAYATQEIIECPKIEPDNYLGVKCWRIFSPEGVYRVVGPESKKEYYKHLSKIVEYINQKVINPSTKKPWVWGDYYLIKENINVVNYPYAQTIHKSQGSTYNSIWLDLQGTKNIRDYDDLARIVYTGSTRPRNLLLIYS